MTRWKCICAYDGGHFTGWQSQPGGAAVQDVLEARIAEVLRLPCRIHGSGRTDAGVHASGQVFHFDCEWRHGPEKLAAALRHRLHRGIQLRSLRRAAPDFHARFSATGKIYSYHIHLGDADPFTRPYCWMVMRPLALPRLVQAAAVLRGRHDFRAFSAANGEEPGENADTVRNLRRLDVSARGRNIRIEAEADGFLFKMVRGLVGALVSAGESKLGIEEMKSILDSRKRTPKILTAPAQGLFLTRVLYR